MKSKPIVFAQAFSLATVILWTLCSLFVMLFPGLALIVSQWWMHGLDLKLMGPWHLNFTNFILGGLSLTASAWITGWILGWSFTQMSKK